LAVTRIGGNSAPCDSVSGVDGNGAVCARAFTHKSDSTAAIDAKKSDPIAVPEPDDGSPTDQPHHEAVSMMLSIKVHTGERRRVATRPHLGQLAAAAERCGRHARRLVSAADRIPAHRPGRQPAALFIVNI
jgi:hypothetical protein